jgi:chromate reductase
MRILAISGSLREDSLNTRLLRVAAGLLPAGEAEMVIADPDLIRAVPPYDADIEDNGDGIEAVRILRDTIAQADAVLFATPEYNGSIPGQLKNALDWVSRPLATNPLKGKPVAVVGASTGLFGAVWAQAELRKVLGIMGARVVDRELPLVQAAEQFNGEGDLVEDELREQLAEHVAELVASATPAAA